VIGALVVNRNVLLDLRTFCVSFVISFCNWILNSNYKYIHMPVLRAQDAVITKVKEGVERRLIHTNDLMTVVIDFSNGPWSEPEPPHYHVHEQTTYIAEGEIIFFCEGEPDQRLRAGDMFSVPSNKKHTIQLLTKHVRLIDSFNPIRQEFIS
jgi:quercetin dioxygenase-like cupin family protein